MSMVTYLSNRLAETKAELAAERAKVARLREALKRAMIVYGGYSGAHNNLECWKNARAALKDTQDG